MTAIDLDPSLPPVRGRRGGRVLLSGATAVLLLSLGACSSSGTQAPDASSVAGSPAASVGGTSAAASSGPGTSTAAPRSTGGSDSSFGTEPTGAAVSADLCRLLTKDEAETAVGAALKAGKSKATKQSVGPVGSCTYVGADLTHGPTIVNVIVLGTSLPRAVWEKELKGDPDAGPLKAVPGLGEDAFSMTGIASVYDHGTSLTVQMINKGVPAQTAVIVGVLRTVLGRAHALG